MILTTKLLMMQEKRQKTCTPSFQTSCIWRRHAFLCICMYFCYPQANKCLSSDTCKWKRFLLPETPTLILTKRSMDPRNPQNICPTKPVCSLCMPEQVLMLGLVEALGGVCCSKGYYLSAANSAESGPLGNEREEITPGILHSRSSEAKTLFWENMQPCADYQ